jgi:hypothetical protein
MRAERPGKSNCRQPEVLIVADQMTLFLDPELRVRWFTSAIRALFPLTPHDIGRHITDFVPRFDDENFIRDVHAVMEKKEPPETEVRNREGAWFLRRIRPYLAESQNAYGVAVTFTDISELKRTAQALRESQSQLAVDLADTQQLHHISNSLIKEQNLAELYDQILAGACQLMRSAMASVQELRPERNDLFLLAQRGFAPESARYWQWVSAEHTSACGVALSRAEPVIVADTEAWDLVAGTEDLRQYRLSGIRAILSMPLVSRDGNLVGIMSTHWREVRQPSERELRLLDVLARQVADLIERTRVQEATAEESRNTKILQDLSTRLVKEQDTDTIYEAILTAAMEITRAAAGTVQMLDAETQ